MTGTTRRAASKTTDDADQAPSIDPTGATTPSEDSADESQSAPSVDVAQAVLDVLAQMGLTPDDLKAAATAKAQPEVSPSSLAGGSISERAMAHRQRADEIEASDPDEAERLRLTARKLHAEHKLAVAQGDKYNPYADICGLHFPDGWPLDGSHHASCPDGEYDR